MTSKYTSDELFHFVGHSSPKDNEENYRKLKIVLKGQCISHPPHDGTWGNTGYSTAWESKLETEGLVIPTVTCYADIPFNALSIHINKYGCFGVALPSSELIKYGARPVSYVPLRSDDWQSVNGTMLLRDIEAAVKGFNELVVEPDKRGISKSRRVGKKSSTPQDAISTLQKIIFKDFLAFLKPFNSELPHNHPDNFYMEREWRKYGNMKFSPKQISRVIVAKKFKKRLETDFPEYEGKIFEI